MDEIKKIIDEAVAVLTEAGTEVTPDEVAKLVASQITDEDINNAIADEEVRFAIVKHLVTLSLGEKETESEEEAEATSELDKETALRQAIKGGE